MTDDTRRVVGLLLWLAIYAALVVVSVVGR